MSWLAKLFGNNPEQARRIARAHEQRADAAELLAESRELAGRLRRHEQRNNFTARMAAAYERRDRP